MKQNIPNCNAYLLTFLICLKLPYSFSSYSLYWYFFSHHPNLLYLIFLLKPGMGIVWIPPFLPLFLSLKFLYFFLSIPYALCEMVLVFGLSQDCREPISPAIKTSRMSRKHWQHSLMVARWEGKKLVFLLHLQTYGHSPHLASGWLARNSS